jgi:D-inositol-3-phosphate glycosyltransferase
MNVFNLARWLSARGWVIALYVLPNSRLALKAIEIGLAVKPIEKHRKYFDFGKAKQLARLLKQNGDETVFIFHNYDTDVASLAKRFFYRGMKLVYQQHMQLGVSKRGIIHTMRYAMFDRWITLLDFLYKEIGEKTRFDLSKVSLISLGLEVDRFVNSTLTKEEAQTAFNVKPQCLLLGIIGRLDKLKGQDFLVKALAALIKKGQNVELLIVGEPTLDNTDNYEGQLHALVKELGLENRVHFRPFVADSTLFYKAVDVFTMASAGETYGMVTIEAMLSGTPVVATNTSGTPEILGNGTLGYLYSPGNIDEFVAQVEFIVANPVRAREISEHAQQAAKHKFAHNVMCADIEKLLERV